jgi:hypothetical protein
MNLKKILLTGLLTLPFVTLAQSENNTSTVNSQPQTANVKEEKAMEITAVDQDVSDAESLIEGKIQAYYKKHGIPSDGEFHNRYFVHKIETGLNVNDPNFYRKKILLYEKAYMEALADVANFIGTKILSETERELFSDNSGGEGFNKEVKLSPGESLKAKILAATDAALNKILEKLGINPEQYGHLTLEKKRLLALDAIKKRVVTKAIAELSGTTAVFTTEGYTKDGDYAVGVVVMYSPKLKQFAYDIANGLEPIRFPKGKPLSAYLPRTKEGWLAAWGPRVVIDEYGYPAIIAYGQWAVPLNIHNRARLNIYKKAAKEQAINLARSYIAEFVNSQVGVESITKVGSEIADELVKKIPGDTFEVNKDIITDLFKEKIRRISQVKISGIQPLAEKMFDVNAGGRKYRVYVIALSWSYKGFLTANKIKNWKPSREHQNVIEETQKREYKSQTFEGPEGDIYDW